MKVIGRDKFVGTLSPLNNPADLVKLGEILLVEMPSAAGGVFDCAGISSNPSMFFNPMTGPIFVEGIEVGDTIGLKVHEIRAVGYGKQGDVVHMPRNGRLHFLGNLSVAMEPSIGCMGVSPAEITEEISSHDSGKCGGNIDCRDFAAGATIFFKAKLPGAMFSMGDVHLAMGDGEVEGQGVESAADAVISVWKCHLSPSEYPWLVRGGEIMCIGSDENMATAIHLAYEGLISLLENLFSLSRAESQARIGPAGSVRICQSCCRIKTVRLCLPLDLMGMSEEGFLEKFLEQKR